VTKKNKSSSRKDLSAVVFWQTEREVKRRHWKGKGRKAYPGGLDVLSEQKKQAEANACPLGKP